MHLSFLPPPCLVTVLMMDGVKYALSDDYPATVSRASRTRPDTSSRGVSVEGVTLCHMIYLSMTSLLVLTFPVF